MSQPAHDATSERRLPAARLTDAISWAETECEAFSKFRHATKDEKSAYLHMLCMAILDLRDDVLEALRKEPVSEVRRNIPTEPPLEATQAVLEWNRGFFVSNKLQSPLEIGMELSLAGRIWGIMAEAYNKRAIPSAIPRFQDQNRLEWVCERLAQHSMYIKQYDHAHELPRGGFAFYTNSTLLGYGETIVDAIDAAMKAEAANVK